MGACLVEGEEVMREGDVSRYDNKSGGARGDVIEKKGGLSKSGIWLRKVGNKKPRGGPEQERDGGRQARVI